MPEPDPRDARTPAEYVARLQALKEWSGLTYRELTVRAEALGEVLPRSTVANMLSRATVPREELVAAFVRACGCGPAAVTEWLAVRKELTAGGGRGSEPAAGPHPRTAGAPEATVPEAAGPKSPPDGPRGGRGSRLPRAKVLVPSLALLVTAATAALLVGDFPGPVPGSGSGPAAGSVPGSRPATGSGSVSGSVSPPGPVRGAPAPGERTLRAVHSGLCLAERAGAGSGKVHQAPCKGRIPKYSLVKMDGENWRIASWHPQFEDGCMGVRWGRTGPGVWLEDDVCENRNPAAETFRFEPVGSPVKGYRIRPLHTDMCVTVPGAAVAEWTALEQRPCTADAAGQLFRFDPVGADGS
ncbi:helix-turn-helix domain-containing protein [Streptomyces sp. NPDC004111]|uniref:helix-turn-helix domain-containing protein n=1 Tax=Streptomyces sp. NPDC004111 TaxID=3364690 RepID=UPI0036C3CB81